MAGIYISSHSLEIVSHSENCLLECFVLLCVLIPFFYFPLTSSSSSSSRIWTVSICFDKFHSRKYISLTRLLNMWYSWCAVGHSFFFVLSPKFYRYINTHTNAKSVKRFFTRRKIVCFQWEFCKVFRFVIIICWQRLKNWRYRRLFPYRWWYVCVGFSGGTINK